MSKLPEGITLTVAGEDTLKIIEGIFPNSSEEENFRVLVELAKEEPENDYIRAERVTAINDLVTVKCKLCEETHRMSLGWLGHVQWIQTKLCPLCHIRTESVKK
jgi:hypothetical protein